jgi:hypothetical protein
VLVQRSLGPPLLATQRVVELGPAGLIVPEKDAQRHPEHLGSTDGLVQAHGTGTLLDPGDSAAVDRSPEERREATGELGLAEP